MNEQSSRSHSVFTLYLKGEASCPGFGPGFVGGSIVVDGVGVVAVVGIVGVGVGADVVMLWLLLVMVSVLFLRCRCYC